MDADTAADLSEIYVPTICDGINAVTLFNYDEHTNSFLNCTSLKDWTGFYSNFALIPVRPVRFVRFRKILSGMNVLYMMN